MYSRGQYFKTKCHTLSTGVCSHPGLGGGVGGQGEGAHPRSTSGVSLWTVVS